MTRFDICKRTSSSRDNDLGSDQAAPSENKENEGEGEVDQENLTQSPVIECLQSSNDYVYSGPLTNVSELILTTNDELKGRWINLSDITKILSSSESAQISYLEGNPGAAYLEENPSTTGDNQIYILEVPDDILTTQVECNSIVDAALTMSGIAQQDQVSPVTYDVNAVEQCCPSADNNTVIDECCQGLLQLQHQLVPESQNDDHDYRNTIDASPMLNTGNGSYNISAYAYGNTSSPERSPVMSQRNSTDHYVTSPRLTDLLSSPIGIVPQDTSYSSEDHRFPGTNMMSPFIVPSSPEVSNVLRGCVPNPITTEELSQSPNSQDADDDTGTPCCVMTEDPLSYVSPFTTPRLGFSPTFAELSPGRTVSDNESFHQESPIQRVPLTTVCQVTDFSEVGLTSVAASVEICSSSGEPQVTRPKRKYRKRQPKVQAGESPILKKKTKQDHSKTPRVANLADSAPKKAKKPPKSRAKNSSNSNDDNTAHLQETPLPKPTHIDLQDQNSFKTPSPQIRRGKLKRVGTPDSNVPRKQAKKEPTSRKSVCKRQLINS